MSSQTCQSQCGVDEVCTLATAAYNFLPNEHSRESPFFIMFGRDPKLPLAELFQHKLRYLGTDETILSLQALRNMYLIIAENLRKARERSATPCPKKAYPNSTKPIGDIESPYPEDFRPTV